MKTATLERKTPSPKALHPTELIRKIQKGLPFSELETLQNKIDLPRELFARHGSGAHLPAMEDGFTAVDGTHAGRRSFMRANMNLLQRWNYSSTSSRYLPPSDISRFDSNWKIN